MTKIIEEINLVKDGKRVRYGVGILNARYVFEETHWEPEYPYWPRTVYSSNLEELIAREMYAGYVSNAFSKGAMVYNPCRR